MAVYKVILKASAGKELDAIDDAATRWKVSERIESLAEEPRGHGCEKLAGPGNQYRVRQGDFRILYEIREVVKVVAVLKIGNRREVYRK